MPTSDYSFLSKFTEMKSHHLLNSSLLFITLLLLSSCNSNMKRNKSSKFYSLIVNKEWAVLNDQGGNLGFRSLNDTIIRLRTIATYMDSTKAETRKHYLESEREIISKILDTVKISDDRKRDLFNEMLHKADTSTFNIGYEIPVLKFNAMGEIKYIDSAKDIYPVDSYEKTIIKKSEWGIDSNTLVIEINAAFLCIGCQTKEERKERNFHFKNEYQISSSDSSNITLRLIRR
jgi:hypothetical protein